MSRLLRCVLVALLATGSLVLSPGAQAVQPVRVLLTGDSITHGFDGDYTWRYRLAVETTRQGVPLDFVGSKRLPYVKPGWATAVYAAPGFDSDHFATGGSRLAQHVEWIGAEARQQRPDVVVFAAGVNDLRWRTSPERLDTLLRAWVNNLRAATPHARIVLSPVLDAMDPTRPWLSAAVTDYNTRLRATALELSTEVSPITVADTDRGWDVHDHTSEDLHPNPTGEAHIAQRVAEELHRVGVLPSAPLIYRSMAWERNLPVEVSLDARRRAVTRWDAQAVTGARVSVRLGGGTTRVYDATSRGTFTTPQLVPGGVYEFRLIALRGRMESTLGPITRVRVPALPVARRPLVLAPGASARVRISAGRVRWAPAARASSYVVKVRRAGSATWHTKRTRSTRIAVRGIARAKVWAVNSAGRSRPTRGHR